MFSIILFAYLFHEVYINKSTAAQHATARAVSSCLVRGGGATLQDALGASQDDLVVFLRDTETHMRIRSPPTKVAFALFQGGGGERNPDQGSRCQRARQLKCKMSSEHTYDYIHRE